MLTSISGHQVMLSYKSRGQRYEKTLQHTYIYPRAHPSLQYLPGEALGRSARSVHACTLLYTRVYTRVYTVGTLVCTHVYTICRSIVGSAKGTRTSPQPPPYIRSPDSGVVEPKDLCSVTSSEWDRHLRFINTFAGERRSMRSPHSIGLQTKTPCLQD